MTLSKTNEKVLAELLERMKGRSVCVHDFWRFLMLCFNTPRPSTNYDGVDKPERSLPFRKVIREICAERGLIYREDQTGNMIISNFAVGEARMCFQGHMDVVVSKNESEIHNFETEGVDVRLTEAGTVKPVKGITLGADNGVAIAAGLACLCNHGSVPLELLVTTNEETSFDGACGLDVSLLTAKTILNLDSEVENAICVGSAGGFEEHFSVPVCFLKSSTQDAICLQIKDLKGGHSGIDIGKEKSNAILIMMRLLLSAGDDVRIVSIQGGTSTNAIPRECTAILVGADLGRISTEFERIKLEIALVEDSVQLMVNSVVASVVMDTESTHKVVRLLAALPNGVVRRSGSDVESSLNLGIVQTDLKNDTFEAKFLVRSTSSSWMRFYSKQLAAIGALVGAKVAENVGFFSAWEPLYTSRLLSDLKQTHAGTLAVYTVHAGLECSTIMEKLAQVGKLVECASIGPQIDHAHSPDECLFINSAIEFVEWIERLIGKTG